MFFFLQFPSQYPTVRVTTAVSDCESSSYAHSCAAPPTSASSSLNHIFLSPGQTLPVSPAVSPLSPLHTETMLVSPTPLSLSPSPSPALLKIGPTSPQPCTAVHQSVRAEAPHTQAAFISSLPAQTMHSHSSSSPHTHPHTNGSTQSLTQVISLAGLWSVDTDNDVFLCVCVRVFVLSHG